MTRDEIIKELRCLAAGEDCPSEKCDNTCPYWTEIERGAALYDDRQLCRAAADMLEKDVKHNPADIDEICALRARVENLTLYLQEAFAICPDELAVLDEWHPGLPGYAPPQECKSCKIDD